MIEKSQVLTTLILQIELGEGGGLRTKFYDGVCGPNLEDTPIHIKAKPENHTYSYNLT